METNTATAATPSKHLRLVVSLACLCLVVGGSSLAQASEPTAADIQRAAGAFDAGSAAYRQQRYAAAASFFEAADSTIRSARALRMAIRSRDKAGQPARAATLAAQALRLYPGDEKTKAMATELIERCRSQLHRLEVRCTEPCVLAAGRRVIPGEALRRATLYLKPGETSLRASFSGLESERQVVVARAGGRNRVYLSPAPTEALRAAGANGAANKASTSFPQAAGGASDTIDTAASAPGFFASPAFFYTLGGATAVVGAVTIWSGVDTLNNPGADAVRDACAGLGPDCAAYQDGRVRQLRTNVLIGGSAVLGASTLLVGLLATEWTTNKTADSKEKKSASLRPWSRMTWDEAGRPSALFLGLSGRL